MLILTRQNLPVFDRQKTAPASGVLNGAYVLSKEKGEIPEVILMATGSEVHLALAAQGRLMAEEEIDARVVSLPSWELFREQPLDYRDKIFPPEVRARLAIEAAAPMGWCEWVGDFGRVLGITRFGASAPGKENFSHFGFTVDNVVKEAARLTS